ncbi:hypothetical protein WA158_000845 [Blastocystis sp. Blastoise]
MNFLSLKVILALVFVLSVHADEQKDNAGLLEKYNQFYFETKGYMKYGKLSQKSVRYASSLKKQEVSNSNSAKAYILLAIKLFNYFISSSEISKESVQTPVVSTPPTPAPTSPPTPAPTSPPTPAPTPKPTTAPVPEDQIPVCDKLKIYYIPIGGLGNQMNLFMFLYLISSIEKIPVYIPEHNMFAYQYTLKEFFPGQFQKYSWDVFLDALSNVSRRHPKGPNWFNINGFRGRRRVEAMVNNRNLCDYYPKYKRWNEIWVYGYEIIPDLIYEHPLGLYNNTLTELGLYHNEIYNHSPPGHPFRYEFYLFNTYMKPYKRITDYMLQKFPTYQKDNYLSVHIRFGKSYSDLNDTPKNRYNGNPFYPLLVAIRNRLNQTGLQYAYIASDSSSFKSYMKRELGDKVLTLDLGKIVHTDLLFNKDLKSLEDNGVIALAELYLLSNGKDCIGSAASSFSHLACSNIQTNALMT